MEKTMSLSSYFSSIVVTGPTEQKMSQDVRALMRWWLEFARNTLVCAALTALAFKTKDFVVSLFALATISALTTFIMTYVNAYSINLFPGVRSRWLNYVLFSVGTALFIAATNIFVIDSVINLLRELAV